MKNLGSTIQKLIDGKNLDRNEAFKSFEAIFKNEVSEFDQGAFLAAIATKGENSDEILGCYEAIYKYDTVKVNPGKLDITENSGTGRDNLKTFNASSAAAIVAAAAGINIAKHGARAITSKCGSIDILEAIGINIDLDPEKSIDILKEIGITVFNGMSPKVHQGVLYNILSKIHFGSIFNISASLASPVRPSYGVRGVFNKDIIAKIASVMKKIGYKKGIVFWGNHNYDEDTGMDEISPTGETFIIEFDSSGFSEMYVIDPSYFKLPNIDLQNILALDSIEGEKNRFLSVLKGENFPECIDFVAINTSPILYINEVVPNMKEGYEMAKELIYSGKAWQKYIHWKNISKDIS